MIRKSKAILLSGMMIWMAASAPLEASEQARGSAGQRARRILNVTGMKGGLVVHLGCGAGELTAALRADDSYVVQGLDRDAEAIEKARQYLQSKNLNGPVSVLHWDKNHLPYVNNLVNLVVSEDPRGVSMKEIMRVLAPLGVAYVKQDGKWIKQTKPRPEEIDDWTHRLYDAGNNAVSRDSRVGPPRYQQWFSDPKWSRHHEQMSSVSALVSSGTRVFYIVDKGSYVSPMLPSDWKLVARDGNNGTRLWSRPMGRWASRFWPMKNGPSVLTRRLVAMDDVVYVTLGINAPISVLDAATGKTLEIYAETAGTDEFVVSKGTLFAVLGEDEEMFAESKYRPHKENITQERNRVFELTPYQQQRTIVAVDTSRGEKLWQRKTPVANLGLAADASRVVFHDRERVVCLDRAKGGILWESEPVPLSPHKFGEGATLLLYKDLVLFSGDAPRDYGRGKPALVTALSADSGTTLWQQEYPTSGHRSAQDVFAIGDAVWAGQTSSGGQEGTFCVRDARSGDILKEFNPDVDVYWFHHRCHRGVATEKYILTSRTGVEFVDVRKEQWDVNHWVRGTCHYGIMPANGLLYAPPHPCACYMESKLTYFNALAPASGQRYPGAASEKESRLERGPAFGKVDNAGQVESLDAEWPTFRCDNQRSGYSPRQIPSRLEKTWEAPVGGSLSSLVVADGKLLVASVDRHAVYALDAFTGKRLWKYTTGGRVNSPPTIVDRLVLFGSDDGYVYCLLSDGGELFWRYRVAPDTRQMMARQQLQSPWSVPGSILVKDGTAYCVGGRSRFLDGGMHLVGLEIQTGQPVVEKTLDENEWGKNLHRMVEGLDMPPAMGDVLSSRGSHIFMRSQAFDLDGNPVPPKAFQGKERFKHLFSPTGFLDDSWFHRSYWLYGTDFISGWNKWYNAAREVPAGRLMVHNEKRCLGYGRKHSYYRWASPLEYHLFAVDKIPNRVKREGKTGGYMYPAKEKLAYDWSRPLPFHVRAMVLGDETLFVAGPPNILDEERAWRHLGNRDYQRKFREQADIWDGSKGSVLWAVSAETGDKKAEYPLRSIPVFDGLASAYANLYIALEDGRVVCWEGRDATDK